MEFNFHIPTKILFGPGKLKDLADEALYRAKTRGRNRVMAD